MTVLESPKIDDEAFERLCRDHGAALLAFCRSRLGAAGQHDAEDACQEALLRAYRALPEFEPGRELWPWLATIAANVCTDIHRRRRAEPVPPSELARHGEPVDTDELVATRMRKQVVSTAIKDLPHEYRRHVYLADVAGWSYADIASHERTTVASVRSSLHRGRRQLRTRMHQLRSDGRLWGLPVLVPGLRLRRRPDPTAAAEVHVFLPCLPTLAQAAAAVMAVMAVLAPGAGSSGITEADRTASWSTEEVGIEAGDLSVTARLGASAATTASHDDEDDDETIVVEAPGANLEAASDVHTRGPWRVVHVHVHGDVAGLPYEGGVQSELHCRPAHDPNPAFSEVCEHTQDVAEESGPGPVGSDGSR